MNRGWLGLPWISWFAIGVNFGSAFVNGWILGRWKRKAREWNEVRLKYDAQAQRVEHYAEHFDKLIGFAIMLANAPNGAIVNDELRALAKSLIPPEVTYDVKVVYEGMTTPSSERLH